MTDEGIVPHGGMLAWYILALMRSGDWELALEIRERYRMPRKIWSRHEGADTGKQNNEVESNV